MARALEPEAEQPRQPKRKRTLLVGIVHRDVESFASVAEIAGALAEVDRLREQYSAQFRRLAKGRKRQLGSVFRFTVGSEPQFTTLLHTDWVVVFVTVLIGYHHLKRSAREAAADAAQIRSMLVNLSEAQARDVKIGLRLFAASIAKQGESAARSLARRFSRIRRVLLSENGRLPSLSVTEDD